MKLLVILVFINSIAFGQVQLMSDQMGKPLQSPKMILEGSPYLFDEWNSSMILGPDNRIKPVTIEKTKINLLTGVVEFDLNGTVLELRPELYETVELKRSNEVLKFKKGFKNKGLMPEKLYQILFDGDLKLLKYHTKTVTNGTGSTYGSQVNKVLEYDFKYYFLKGDQEAVPIKQSKKFFKEFFGADERARKVLEDFNGNFKNERDLISFINLLSNE